MKAYSHLSAEERIRIDELRNRDGLGVRQIALRIGRDKATVSRELKRGLWFASNENDSYRPYRPKRLKTGPWTCRPFYSAMTAQRKAEQRAREPRKPRRMAYDPLLAWVMTALRKGWTPERIEGRLAVEFPDDPRMRVSHECLYQWIYAKPQRILDLRQYLPRGKRRRTRAKGRRSKGPRIPMRVPIAQRPKRVDSRHEFGHFESDTVIGTAPSKRCIDTQVERKSRRCLCSISCCGFSHDDFSGLGRACRPRNGLNWMVLVSPPERTGKDYDQHAPSTVYPSFAAERGIRRVDRAENTCRRSRRCVSTSRRRICRPCRR